MTAKVLKDELATYEKERKRLEKEHLGKFVLIHGDEVIDTFDNFQNAADEGLRRFGDAPFLIRQIGREEAHLSPAVIFGLTRVNTPHVTDG